jgi:CheY-like chemotaxis protein
LRLPAVHSTSSYHFRPAETRLDARFAATPTLATLDQPVLTGARDMSKRKDERSQPKDSKQALIYVVDDEAMLLELATLILQPLGYEVQTFRDPTHALRSFSASQPRPSLLITDYSMHQMDGLGLIEACRRLEPLQKVLLISGTVGPEITDQARVKPDRFLAKPYQAKQLIELVQSMLAN